MTNPKQATTTADAPSVKAEVPPDGGWLIEVSDTPKGVLPRIVTHFWYYEDPRAMRKPRSSRKRKPKPLSSRKREFYESILSYLRQSVEKVEDMLAAKPTRHPNVWVIEVEENQLVVENKPAPQKPLDWQAPRKDRRAPRMKRLAKVGVSEGHCDGE